MQQISYDNIMSDYIIMSKYLELFKLLNTTAYNSDDRDKSIRNIFDYTITNLNFVLHKNEFKLIIIKKILEFYFSTNSFEQKTASEYLYLLKILHPKHIYPK